MKDPSKVIFSLSQPILEPETKYEKIRDVPNVVFPEGAVVMVNNLFIYYGGGDKVCCVATVNLDEFLDYILTFKE